jgi:hypothetical protein
MQLQGENTMLHDFVKRLSKSYLQRCGVKDKAECSVKARAGMRSGLKIGGVFDVVCRDADGNIKWHDSVHNIWVNSGLGDLLDVYFKGATQDSTWFVGLYTDSSPSATWTATSDLTEFTSYSGTRKAYTPGSITGTTTKQMDNSSNKASFSITGSGTVYGAFLCKLTSGAASIACAANFGSARTVASGDTVEVTYTLQTTDDGA